MTINDQINDGQKQYGYAQTSYFKFTKGDNRLRILTKGEILATHFFGKGVKASTCYGIEKGCPFHGKGAPKDDKGVEKKPSIKYVCYVLNGTEIQLADLPYSVIKQVGEYQTNIDYQFDDFPMPYDITVKFNPDSLSPNDMYKVIASPRRENISQDILDELDELMRKVTPETSVQKKKDFQMNAHKEQGILVELKTTEQLNKEHSKKIETGEIDEVDSPVEYPENVINPDDIPF